MKPTFQIFGVPEDGVAEQVAADVLRTHFSGDMDAAKACQMDCQKQLNAGDSDAENDAHAWSKIESAMSDAIFAKCPVIESKWAGVAVMWN